MPSITIPDEYLAKIIFTLGSLIVAYIVSFIIKKSVDVVFSGVRYGFYGTTLMSRTRTIRSLLKNSIDIVIFLTAILIILARWDINIMPLLTGAGIAGLAISFGAQTLVKDIISGFFIIVENQFSVGDYIEVSSHAGTVENLTLRMTVLRDDDGNIAYIPNSQITTVVRYGENRQISKKKKK